MQYAPSFDALARVFEFGEFVDLYLIHNSSAASPFHNFKRACWEVEDTFRYYRSLVEADVGFDREYVRLLLIASLFKDVNHGTGRCSDETNITNAILTLYEANQLARTPLNQGQLKVANSLISSSLFVPDLDNPSFPHPVVSGGEQALRDAILSTVFRAFDPEGRSQYVGFLEEINLTFALAGVSPLTMRGLVDKTSAFMMKAPFYTPLGCKTRDRHLKKCLDRLGEFAREWDYARSQELKL